MVSKNESLHLTVLMAYNQFALNEDYKHVTCFGQDSELTQNANFLLQR